MKLKKMTWKRVVALFCAIVLLGTSIPMENLRAAGELEVSLGNDIVLEIGNESTDDDVANLTAEVLNSSGEVKRTIWTSTNENVARVGGGQVTAVGPGEARITAEVTLEVTDEEGKKDTLTGIGEVNVKVYETPALELTTSSVTYPGTSEFKLNNVPNGAVATIQIFQGETELHKYEGNEYSIALTPGNYTVVGTSTETGYYRAGKSAEIVHAVSTGTVDFTVDATATEAYITDEVKYTVRSGETGVVTVKDETTQETLETIEIVANRDAEFVYKCAAQTNAKLIFEFKPNNAYYDVASVEHELTVNKIPVKATWANDTKTYDGTKVYETTDIPTFVNLVEGKSQVPTSVVNESFTFELNDANTGTRTATYDATASGTLALTDADAAVYVIEEIETVQVTVNKVKLTAADIDTTGFAANGKNFDGDAYVEKADTSTITFTPDSLIIAAEKDSATVGYTAEYAVSNDKNPNADPVVTRGSVYEDTTVDRVVLSDFKVLINGEESENYTFDGHKEIKSGSYDIVANTDFFTFTGIESKEIGGYAYKEGVKFFWIRKNVSTIKESGYSFANSVDGSFTDNYTVKSDSDTVYAKNSEGWISQPLIVGLDEGGPEGSIYVQISNKREEKPEKLLSLEEFLENYTQILDGDTTEVQVIARWDDNDIKTIEYFSSDVPVDASDKWPSDAIKVDSEKIPSEPDKQFYIVDTIDEISDVKKFYYVRLEDKAEHVLVMSSSGVLKDVTAPAIVANNLEATTTTYNNIGVYTGDTNKTAIKLTLSANESGVTSGVSFVKVVLSKWNETEYQVIKEYDANSEGFWTNDKMDDIAKMENEKFYPTNGDIEAVSGTLDLSATFNNLEDGKYSYKVIVGDKAGNSSETAVKEFIVDTKAPVINVTNNFVNDHNKHDDDTFTSGAYTITISDMTLVDDAVNAACLTGLEGIDVNWTTINEANGAVTKKTVIYLGSPELPEEEKECATIIPDNGTYSFALSAVDILEKKDSKELYEFIYDTENPKYTVEFTSPSEASVVEGNTVYHNTDITAKFEIVESSSYDENKIEIVVYSAKTDDNGQKEVVASWKQGVLYSNEKYNSHITMTHESGTKLYEVAIKKDSENHITDDDGYTFEIRGTDKTGYELMAATVNNESAAEHVAKVRVLDTIVPDLTNVSYDTIEKFNTVNGKDYVNANTTITFALNEHNPYDSVYTLTSETPEDEEATVLTWTPVVDEEGKNVADQYVTNYVVPQFGEKGDTQTITLTIVDKAGNKAIMSGAKRSDANTTFADGEFADVFVVDAVAPIITYEYIDDNPNNVNVNGIDYFKEKAQVKVTVDEHNFDESCTVKPYVTAKNEANIAYTESDWVSTGDVHVKTFTFENDNEYEIKIDATDCALNDFVLGDVDEKITVKKDESNPGTTALKLAVDKTLTAIGDTKKPVVVVNPVQNPGTTTDGQALYNTDVVYEVSVYDPKVNNYASGIDEIEITLTAEDGTTAKAIIAKDGTVTTETGMNVVLMEGVAGSLAQGEENKYVYYVTIAKDTFNSNGIKMVVKATDISTNVTSKTDVQAVAIDTTDPTVVIDYNNDDVRNGKYFHKGRTATITVTERNFSDDCLNFYVNNKRIDLTFTLKNAGTGNRDDAVWVAKHKINKDGDYVIKCDVKDRVENEGTISYEGKATKKFTVDKTMPKIALSFNNNNAQNNSYYSSARTATITITEHNFRGSDIEITGTANNAGSAVAFPGISKWKSKGDVHTATITFTEDALYSLDIAYKDLALNAAKSPENNTFTIDNTDPEITFSDVKNGGAYPDEVIPKILFNDNNYLSHTITLTRTNRENTNEDVTSKFVKSSGVNVDGTGKANGSNTIPDIAHEQENDGIYTITVTVKDKAGRSKTETISYSVNRFGSVYVYSDDLLALLNGYTKLEDISNKDLSITAYNADSLIAEETKLEITCDGAALTSQKSKADVKKAKLDSDGWYAYRFQLDTADFEKEGSYVVMISDKDTAGNVQTNSDNPIEFSIDGTDPKLDSVIGLEEERYNTEEQTVKYTVSDAMGIAKIEIYIDGKVVETIEEFDNAATYEGQFVIPESSDRQSVKIVVTDKAGRVLDTSSEAFANDAERGYVFNSSVLVSTSLFDLWYDNKPVFWGSIAGVAALLGLFFFIILGKKKKEEDEEDEVA